MKFAMVNDQRQEAQKGLPGKCPLCADPMIAKCGIKRAPHWAHKGKLNCDHWWENETEWHRTWKNQFPVEWQEQIHWAENGEKHIADIKTDQEWVVEFQHSFLKPEERKAREAFYKKMVWVVDGTRRKKDKPKFIEMLKHGLRINAQHLFLKVSSDECALLEEWEDCQAPVFFDLRDESGLWWLLPKDPDGKRQYFVIVDRKGFVERFRFGPAQPTQNFEEIIKAHGNNVNQVWSLLRAQSQIQYPPIPSAFQIYQARRNRYRRRF